MVDSPRQRLVVIGQGYVGLPLAVLAVDAGYQVLGIDVDASRVQQLHDGVSYVDDVTDGQLQAALASQRYEASTGYEAAAGFDVAVITVPTPLRNRFPDLGFVRAAARKIAPHIKPGSLVILESTTYPGTTERVVRPLLEKGSGLSATADFALAYSPERVDPGNETWTLSRTPKVVAGVNEASLEAARDFYAKLVADVVPVSSTKTAEMTKLLENTFRHVNIALVNEFAIFAHELEIDIWEVVRAASSKPFGYMPFSPGPGVGGHCLPIDPTYLSWHVEQATGRKFRFIDLANDINEHMPDYVVQRIAAGLNERGKPVRGSVVLLVGLAYKRNSSDARESPATRIVQLLGGLGARVLAADTYVSSEHLATEAPRVDLTPENVSASDALVILADHDDIDFAALERDASWILDCRHCVGGPNVEHL